MFRTFCYLKIADGLLGVDEDARVLAERVQVVATRYYIKLTMLNQARSLIDGEGNGIVVCAESPSKQVLDAFMRELYRLPLVYPYLNYSLGRDYLAAELTPAEPI